MKSIKKTGSIFLLLLLPSLATLAQTTSNNQTTTSKKEKMNTYVIERNIPNAGQLTNEQLQQIAQKSCGVVSNLGPEIEWDHSYVVGDKIFCVYRATNEEIIREHGKEGGFPVDNIYQVSAIFSPESAKGVIQNLK